MQSIEEDSGGEQARDLRRNEAHKGRAYEVGVPTEKF